LQGGFFGAAVVTFGSGWSVVFGLTFRTLGVYLLLFDLGRVNFFRRIPTAEAASVRRLQPRPVAARFQEFNTFIEK